MRKLSLITLLFIFTNSSYALDIQSIKRMFGILKERPVAPTSSNHECCDDEKKEKQTIKQCVIDLCGRATSVAPAAIDNATFETLPKSKATSKDFENYKPKLQKYMDKTVDIAKGNIEKIRRNSNGSEDYFDLMQENPMQIDEAALFELSQMVYLHVVKDENGNKKIIFNKTLDTEDVPAKIIKDFKEYKENNVKNNYHDALLSGYLEVDEGKKILLDAISSVQKIVKEEFSKTDKGDSLALVTLKKKEAGLKEIKMHIKKRKNMQPGELAHIWNVAVNLDYTSFNNLNMPYMGQDGFFMCDGQECFNFLEERIRRKLDEENLSELQSQLDKKDRQKELVDSCKFLWHHKTVNAPKGNNQKNFKKKVPKIIENLENAYLKNFSKKSSTDLSNYLNKMKKKYHDDLPDQAQNNLEYLKYMVDTTVSQSNEEVFWDDLGEYEEEERKSALMDYKTVRNYYGPRGVSFSNTIIDTCFQAGVFVTDHFLPSEYDDDTHVHISQFSCNHHSEGEQVFTHELGHALNNQFKNGRASAESMKKYLKQRECITNSYIDKSMAGRHPILDEGFEGDTKYSEEDMADFISYLAFNDEKSSLYSCTLLPQTVDTKYNLKKISIKNQYDFDTHSSPLVRTLREAIYKNKVLSSSCQGLVDKYSQQINFNKCEQ